MAANAYLRITGALQGKISGSVTLAGREASILILAADHEMVRSHDPATGQNTGKPQHKPFVIVKEVDIASPPLLSMFANNEVSDVWTLDFWQVTATGAEQQFYRVSLTNARIIAIKFEKLNAAYPENELIRERERVAFVYESMTTTSSDGPTSTVNWVDSTV